MNGCSVANAPRNRRPHGFDRTKPCVRKSGKWLLLWRPCPFKNGKMRRGGGEVPMNAAFAWRHMVTRICSECCPVATTSTRQDKKE
eukprot:g26752.t1